MRLADFDEAGADEAAAVVRVWADIPTWVDALVAGRPYDSVDELAAEAALLAADWDRDDLHAAIAQHPRIGEQVADDTAEAVASRGEQSSMASAADDVATAIAEGNTAYEQRFGRVFLIRAAGRSPDEIRGELERRLENDPVDETDEALEQLTEIAILRLRATFTDEES